MRKIWVIARHEYLVNIRRTGFILMTALVPLLGAITLVVMAFFSGEATNFFQRTFSSEPKKVGVVDASGVFTPILPEFREEFALYKDDASAKKALLDGDVSVVLEIPTDYLRTGIVKVLTVGSGLGGEAISDSTRVRAFLISHLLRDLSPEMRHRAAYPAKFVSVTVQKGTGKGKETSGPFGMVYNFLIPYFLAVFLIVTIFVSAGYLLQGIAEEKENRVIEIILSSVSAQELLAGKVIGLGALGLTQVLVWLLSVLAFSGGSVALLSIATPLFASAKVWGLAVVYYVLGFVLYAVAMAALGSLGGNLKEAQQMSGVFSLMAAVPYMVSGFIFTNPNAPVARILSYFPFTAPTMMMMRLSLGPVPVVDILVSILVIAVAIPLVLWAGARLFRVGILMYGKRPGLSELWKAWREAG